MANSEGIEINSKEPTPLSLEGPTVQLELDTDPKPSDKITTGHWKGRVDINKILNTPKETGFQEGESGQTVSPNATSSTIPAKEPAQSVITRLEGEGNDSGAPKDKTPPTTEESKDTAGMIIDGFNALFLFFMQMWSKDTDTKDYEVDTEEKNKLKKYLAAIFFRAEKKINPIWLFIGLLLVMYIPILRKGHNHRKMVLEQRAKNSPNANIVGGPRKRNRKTRMNDHDDGYTPHIEIK